MLRIHPSISKLKTNCHLVLHTEFNQFSEWKRAQSSATFGAFRPGPSGGENGGR